MSKSNLTQKKYQVPNAHRRPPGGRRQLILSLLTAALFACLCAIDAVAVSPKERISQYGHTVWRLEEGYFNGAPLVMEQTKDGYIWVGTQAGLVRFDGANFVPFDKIAAQPLRQTYISSLLTARDGSLWIGTGSFLARWKNGVLDQHLKFFGQVGGLTEDAAGDVWYARTRSDDGKGPLCREHGDDIRCFGTKEGLPVALAHGLIAGPGGEWWLVSAAGVTRWKDGVGAVISLPELAHQRTDGFTAMTTDPNGTILVGSVLTKGSGLLRLRADHLEPYKLPGLELQKLAVTALFVDREKSLWIGTTNQGVYRWSGTRLDHYTALDGLSADAVANFFEDREGNLWVVTNKGIDRFRDIKIATFSTREGLSNAQVDSILVSRSGKVWIGNSDSLDTITGDLIEHLNHSNGLPGKEVTSLLEDRDGRLWIGIDDGLFNYAKRRFTRIAEPDGKAVGAVERMIEGPDGTIWAATLDPRHDLLRIDRNLKVEHIPLPLKSRINAMITSRDGRLWVGFGQGDSAFYTNGKWTVVPVPHVAGGGVFTSAAMSEDNIVFGGTSSGLVAYPNGIPKLMTTKTGLPCNRIHTLTFDDRQTLWLYSGCGLVSISQSELKRWLNDSRVTIKVTRFNILDGAQTASADFWPSVSKGPDGRIWFANSTVAQVVDPLRMPQNSIAPPVTIEGLISDQKPYLLKTEVRLPPRTKDVQISYSAPSFVIPQRVKFRYRLQGWESDWQEADTRRQAFYTNLRPGTYRFQVIAANDDGVWNNTGASIPFTIEPAYYQTRWFQLLEILSLLGLCWLVYTFRLRYVTGQIRQRLGAQMEERERIARELHDTLLQGFQGLVLRFQAVLKSLPPDATARITLDQVLDRADEVLTEGRRSVRELRSGSTADEEITQALTRSGEELAQGHRATFMSSTNGLSRPLVPVVYTEAYRIAREALLNAFQHAAGSRIELEVIYSDSALTLCVRDNGVGIDPTILKEGRDGHWGLSGMQERAKKIGAHVKIWSRPGAGTEVELNMPAELAYSVHKRKSLWERVKHTAGVIWKGGI